MARKFQDLPRIVQFILLLIPVVNWIVEIGVRISAILSRRSTGNILGLILALLIPIFGWVDLVWVLIFKRLALCDC